MPLTPHCMTAAALLGLTLPMATEGQGAGGRRSNGAKPVKTDGGRGICFGGRCPDGADTEVVNQCRIDCAAFLHGRNGEAKQHLGRNQTTAV